MEVSLIKEVKDLYIKKKVKVLKVKYFIVMWFYFYRFDFVKMVLVFIK